jgi:hypothetical protein
LPRRASAVCCTEPANSKRAPQKRYDDTDLIVSEIIENGFDSPRGGRAIARMNALHGRFRIANEDFLYVLSTFVFEPIRWNERFGWRRMTETKSWPGSGSGGRSANVC